jgi:hypothetical protein
MRPPKRDDAPRRFDGRGGFSGLHELPASDATMHSGRRS